MSGPASQKKNGRRQPPVFTHTCEKKNFVTNFLPFQSMADKRCAEKEIPSLDSTTTAVENMSLVESDSGSESEPETNPQSDPIDTNNEMPASVQEPQGQANGSGEPKKKRKKRKKNKKTDKSHSNGSEEIGLNGEGNPPTTADSLATTDQIPPKKQVRDGETTSPADNAIAGPSRANPPATNPEIAANELAAAKKLAAAGRVAKIWYDENGVELTVTQKRKVMREFGKNRAASQKTDKTARNTKKRVRSSEEEMATKRVKTGGKSYLEVTSLEFKMAIVNKEDRMEWRISEAQADEILAYLEDKFWQAAKAAAENAKENVANERAPRYTSSGLIKGHLRVDCWDQHSKEWLKKTVREIALTECTPDCVELRDVPKPAFIKFLTHVEDEKKVLEVLAYQNQRLAVRDWKKKGEFTRTEPPKKKQVRQFAKHGLKFAVSVEDASTIREQRGLFFLMKIIPVTTSEVEEAEEVDRNVEDSADQPPTL